MEICPRMGRCRQPPHMRPHMIDVLLIGGPKDGQVERVDASLAEAVSIPCRRMDYAPSFDQKSDKDYIWGSVETYYWMKFRFGEWSGLILRHSSIKEEDVLGMLIRNYSPTTVDVKPHRVITIRDCEWALKRLSENDPWMMSAMPMILRDLLISHHDLLKKQQTNTSTQNGL